MAVVGGWFMEKVWISIRPGLIQTPLWFSERMLKEVPKRFGAHVEEEPFLKYNTPYLSLETLKSIQQAMATLPVESTLRESIKEWKSDVSDFYTLFDEIKDINESSTIEELFVLLDEYDNTYSRLASCHACTVHCLDVFYAALQKELQAETGIEEREVRRLLSTILAGSSRGRSSALIKDIWVLAQEMNQDSHLVKRLKDRSIHLEDIAAAPQFRKSFDAFMLTYGRQGRFDPVFPRWHETPDYVLSLVQTYLQSRKDFKALEESRAAAREKAYATLVSSIPDAHKSAYKESINLLCEGYEVRNDQIFVIVGECGGYFRELALAIGQYVTPAWLKNREDVFHLYREEVKAITEDRFKGDVASVVAQRAEEFERTTHSMTPPPQFEDSEGRVFVSQMKVITEDLESVGELGSPQTTLRGIGIGDSTYTGTIRHVVTAEDLDNVRNGDIVVTMSCRPEWISFLAPKVGGVITEDSTLVSHAAVLARDYNIPALMGAAHAAHVLKDDMIVTLDPQEGIVSIDMK